MRRLGLAAVVGAALVAALTTPARPVGAQADPVPILGSGSTFAEVALDQWAADVYNFDGLGVDFSGIGSVGGLTQFQQGAVDFASSDVPYADPNQSRGYSYLPIVAGGTALMYNLPLQGGGRIESLRLSPPTIAKIFFGTIREWNHPDIRRENPDLEGALQQLVTTEIRLLVRSPGSGTTGVFTDFLSTAAPAEWQDFVGRSQALVLAGGNYVTDWPRSGGAFQCHCTEFGGSNEIANWIAQDKPSSHGAIGYAETAYAIQLGLPVVAVRNTAGFYRLPTARNVAVALLEAVRNPDGTQNLEAVHVSPREEAYPASSYNYLVIPGDLSPGKGNTLGRYIIYSVTEGQGKSDPLGYSPLPPNLVQQALDAIGQIPGAPAAPPLGEWGRFYEALEPQVIVEVPETPDLGSGGGDPGAVDPGGADPGADPGGGGGGAPGAVGGVAPGGVPGATTTTTSTVPGQRAGTATGPGGRRTTATSIAADGSVVYLDGDVPLARGLRFEDGELVSRDGEPVPKVRAIGIGQLLGISAVLAALVFLPPLVVASLRRRSARAATDAVAP